MGNSSFPEAAPRTHHQAFDVARQDPKKPTSSKLRRAYLMELDPLYCDVIVQRWEQFTGGKAKRIGTVENQATKSVVNST